MALIHCFIPRAALGPGFGKTISAIVFFCLLGPVALARPLLPPGGQVPMAVLQGAGILALGMWFSYFVALNYPEDILQRMLVVTATAAQLLMVAMTARVLAEHYYATSPTGEHFGPNPAMLMLSLAGGIVSSGFLLGAVTMAMLIGHWYLVIPGLPIDWLKGACLAFGGGILIKAIAIAISFSIGAESDPFGPRGFFDQFLVQGMQLFLVRAFVGLFVPAGFCLMAYKAAAIRATQSSTGILFPAMIVVFIGEMISSFLIIGMAGLCI